MNIYNLKDKVIVKIAELENTNNIIDLSFAVYKYNTRGCLKDIPVLTGPITNDLILNLNLQDGKYNIEISGLLSDTELGDSLNQDFQVIYNGLPKLVKSIRKIMCNKNCKECEGDCKELIYNTLFQLNMFLTCTNLVEDLPAYRNLNCLYNNKFNNACMYEKYYGSFNFDYIESIKEILLTALVEMFAKEVSQIRESDLDLQEIKCMFDIEDIERCLYNSNFDLDKIFKLINDINCSCDEL